MLRVCNRLKRGLAASRSLHSLPPAHVAAGLLEGMETIGDSAPFFVLDLDAVDSQVGVWRSHLPGVAPFYAMKSNPMPELVSRLAVQGVSFDCASSPELQQAIDASGVDRTVYAHPIKAASHLRTAAAMGVQLTVVDSVEEVDKLARFAPGMRTLVRLATDDHGARCRLSTKFGAPLSAVPAILQRCAALGVPAAGFSFHVGSGATDPMAFHHALSSARAAFDMAAALLPSATAVLDIGGGFPGQEELFAPMAATISSSLHKLFPNSLAATPDRLSDTLLHLSAHDTHSAPLLMAEPGRFFSEPACTLVTAIVGTRQDAGSTSRHVFLNDGLYGCLNNLLYDHAQAPAAILPDAALRSPKNPKRYAKRLFRNALAAAFRTTITLPQEGEEVKEDEVEEEMENGVLELGGEAERHMVQEHRDMLAHLTPIPCPTTTPSPILHLASATNPTSPLLHARALSSLPSPHHAPATLWGQTCDGFDCLSRDVTIPLDLTAGDWLLFDRAGAYTYAGATTFNGFRAPHTIVVQKKARK